MSARIAYDTKLRRPGCVMIQAALGCEPRVAHLFPSESWLVDMTPDMRVYTVLDGQIDRLVSITERAGTNGKRKAR